MFGFGNKKVARLSAKVHELARLLEQKDVEIRQLKDELVRRDQKFDDIQDIINR